MNGTQNADSAKPALDNQPPGDRPDDENETFGATIDALLNGDAGAVPVDDESDQNDTGDDDDAHDAGAGNDDDGGDDAQDAGADGGSAPPAPTTTGPGAFTTLTGPTAAPSPPRSQTFVVTLRIALTGNDASHPSMASSGHVVAGPQMMGVVTADATPAIVRRVALDDAAALGAALLALPGDYAQRDAARKAAAAARAEADKQERKEQQATQRKDAAAAKKKADLLAAARKAGSALAAAPVAMAATSPPVPPSPPEPTPAASDDVTPASASAPSDDTVPTPRLSPPASSPLPPRPVTGKTTSKTKSAASSTLQPSLFS